MECVTQSSFHKEKEMYSASIRLIVENCPNSTIFCSKTIAFFVNHSYPEELPNVITVHNKPSVFGFL